MSKRKTDYEMAKSEKDNGDSDDEDKYNFDEISDNILSIEQHLLKYTPYNNHEELEMGVKFSPSKYSMLTYGDLLNYYKRIEKVRKTSEIIESYGKTKEVKLVEENMKKISEEQSTLEAPELKNKGNDEKENRKKLELKFESTFENENENDEKQDDDYDNDKYDGEIGELKIDIGKPKKQNLKFESGFENNEELEDKDETEEKSEKLENGKDELVIDEDKNKKEIGKVINKKGDIDKIDIPTPNINFEDSNEPLSSVVFGKELNKIESSEKELKNHRTPELEIPIIIEKKPEKLAVERYQEISARVSTRSKTINDRELKARMLSLTKQLFREKYTSERERIKKEIIRLKNILSQPTSRGKKINLKTILGSLQTEFNSELNQQIRRVNNSISNEIEKSKTEFEKAVNGFGDEDDGKKKAFEMLSSDMNEITEQMEDIYTKLFSFFLKLHSGILEQVKSIASSSELKIDEKILHDMDKTYNVIRDKTISLIKIRINLIIIAEGAKYSLTKNNNKKIVPLIKTIEMSEKELIDYLQLKYPKKYKQYMDKKISKVEGGLYAMKMVAKKEGLSNELMSKYFKGV